MKRLRDLARNETGSFTLEAAIIFPTILLLTFALLVFSIYIYEKAALHYSVSSAVERAAYIWDNSRRDPVTGRAVQGQYDRLYWRVADDRLLEQLFGLAPGAGAVYPLHGKSANTLPERKMRQAALRIPAAAVGEIRYTNGLVRKQIAAEVTQPFRFADRLIGRSGVSLAAAATVSDPVEWIRSIDFVRSYAGKLRGGEGTGIDRDRARDVIAAFARDSSPK